MSARRLDDADVRSPAICPASVLNRFRAPITFCRCRSGKACTDWYPAATAGGEPWPPVAGLVRSAVDDRPAPVRKQSWQGPSCVLELEQLQHLRRARRRRPSAAGGRPGPRAAARPRACRPRSDVCVDSTAGTRSGRSRPPGCRPPRRTPRPTAPVKPLASCDSLPHSSVRARPLRRAPARRHRVVAAAHVSDSSTSLRATMSDATSRSDRFSANAKPRIRANDSSGVTASWTITMPWAWYTSKLMSCWSHQVRPVGRDPAAVQDGVHGHLGESQGPGDGPLATWIRPGPGRRRARPDASPRPASGRRTRPAPRGTGQPTRSPARAHRQPARGRGPARVARWCTR